MLAEHLGELPTLHFLPWEEPNAFLPADILLKSTPPAPLSLPSLSTRPLAHSWNAAFENGAFSSKPPSLGSPSKQSGSRASAGRAAQGVRKRRPFRKPRRACGREGAWVGFTAHLGAVMEFPPHVRLGPPLARFSPSPRVRNLQLSSGEETPSCGFHGCEGMQARTVCSSPQFPVSGCGSSGARPIPQTPPAPSPTRSPPPGPTATRCSWLGESACPIC